MPELITTFGLRTYVFYGSSDFSAAHKVFHESQRKGLDNNGFEDKLEEAEIDFDYEME